MRTVVIAIFLIWSSISGVLSAESVWTHNGSTIKWESDGQKRSASYLQPRPGLENAGIRRGVKLFEGTRKGAVLSGNSYSFKNGCEPISFAVTATVTDERQIVFTGEAPIRSSGCNATTSTRTVTLHLDFVPDEAGSVLSTASPRIPDASLDIPKPSAAVQEKLSALKKESDADRAQFEQGSSFTICNATMDRMSVAFGRNGRVRGWTTVQSGTCELIEKMSSAQRIKYYVKTRNSEFQSGVLELTCVENKAFVRSDGDLCNGSLVGFTRRTLKPGEHYSVTLRPAAGQPEAEIPEGD